MKRIILLLACLASSPSLFAYTVTGSFFYTDRLYTIGSFQGTQVLPIREADVQEYDQSNFQIIAEGATDRNGNFSLTINDATLRNLHVRVIANSTQTPTLSHRVMVSSVSSIYSYSTPDPVLANGSADVIIPATVLPPSFRTSQATLIESIPPDSSAFNIYDLGVYLADYIEHVDGARPFGPGKNYSVRFSITSGLGVSSYSSGSNTFNCAADDGYDDPNILHEMGHYIEDEYGSSSNTGGSHRISDRDQDPRLAWSEGLATYVSNATLNYAAVNRPDIYIDRSSYEPDGAPGGFDYDLEVPFTGGSTSEGSVNNALYDLIDSTSTLDDTVGTDDDHVTGLDFEVWAVLKQMRVLNPPFTSMEDFWDIWLELDLGSVPDVQDAFSLSKVDFLEDQFEPNNTPTNATPLATDGAIQEHSFYREGALDVRTFDEDWFRFSATTGEIYRIKILGDIDTVFGRPDPELALIDLESGEVLAVADDPYDDSLSSITSSDYDNLSDMKETVPSLLFQPTETKNYYLYARHNAKNVNLGGRYGTYQIQVTTEAVPPTPEIDSISIQKMKPGETYSILVIGENFPVGFTFTSNSNDVLFSNYKVLNSDAVIAKVTVDPLAQDQIASLTMNTPYGELVTVNEALTVSSNAQPPLMITKIDLQVETVELRNVGESSADLSGWSLSSNYASGTKGFVFPANAIVPAGYSVSVTDNNGNSTAYRYFDSDADFNWSWYQLSTSPSSTGNVSLVDPQGDAVDTARWVRGYINNTYALLGNNAKWMSPEFLTPPSGAIIGRSAHGGFPRTAFGMSWSNDDLGGGENILQTVDAFEENEMRRQAKLIQVRSIYDNLWIGDKSSFGLDIDWFGVILNSDEEYLATIQFDANHGDLDLEIYAPSSSGQMLASSTAAASNESVTFTADQGNGLYFIKIFGKSETDLAPYALSIVPTSEVSFSDLWLYQ